MGLFIEAWKWAKPNWFRRLTRKETPVSGDVIMLEDSAADYDKKWCTLGDSMGVPGAHASTHITGGVDVVDNATTELAGLMSAADYTRLANMEAGADVTDATNVAAAGAVMGSGMTAKGDILYANSVGTPAALPIGAAGYALSHAGHNANPAWGSMEVLHGDYAGGTLHADVGAAAGFMTGALKDKLDKIEDSADVTDAVNVSAAGALMGTQFVATGELVCAADVGEATHVLVGTAGQVLKSGGHDALPSFASMETLHGNYAGGDLHAAVIGLEGEAVNGFMTAAQATSLVALAASDPHISAVAANLVLTDIDGEVSATLSGVVGKSFYPICGVAEVTFRDDAGGGGPHGDAHLCIGTLTTLADFQADITLTNLKTVGQVCSFRFAGLSKSVLGNAALFVQVLTPDGGRHDGCVLRATVTLYGVQY